MTRRCRVAAPREWRSAQQGRVSRRVAARGDQTRISLDNWIAAAEISSSLGALAGVDVKAPRATLGQASVSGSRRECDSERVAPEGRGELP